MKKLLSVLVAVFAMTATFTSCENDAPEINFSHTTNYTADYSGIIAAINSTSKSIEEKLALINSAIEAQTLTLGQKIDILNTAVENGVLTLQEMTQKLYDVITAQTTTLSERLAAIESAVEQGFIKEETQLKLIYKAIVDLADTLEEQLKAIQKAITDGFIDNTEAIYAVKTAINEYDDNMEVRLKALSDVIKQGFIADSLAIRALQEDNGVYRIDGVDTYLYIDAMVWETIKADTTLRDAICKTMTPMTQYVTVTNQYHWCHNYNYTTYTSSYYYSTSLTPVESQDNYVIGVLEWNDNGVAGITDKEVVKIAKGHEYIVISGDDGCSSHDNTMNSVNVTDAKGTKNVSISATSTNYYKYTLYYITEDYIWYTGTTSLYVEQCNSQNDSRRNTVTTTFN